MPSALPFLSPHKIPRTLKPYALQSLQRPLPRSKNGGILIMQVVYETCLTRIEEKKVAGEFAYNSIPLRPACDPPPGPPAPRLRAPAARRPPPRTVRGGAPARVVLAEPTRHTKT
ncbi:unnamed protein product [Colias eurytheme]|nr:unnamed protein product [Colias eurytheme]